MLNNSLKKQSIMLMALMFALFIFANNSYANGLIITGNSNFKINDSNLIVTHDVDLSGALTVTTGNVTVSGDWTDNNNFVAGNSTVILNGSGTTQTLNGNTTFYNLSKITDSESLAGTLQVNTTGSHVVSNNLTLKGLSGKLLSVNSTTSGTQFRMLLANGKTQALEFLNVKDADASAGQRLLPSNSTNSGNNTNWFPVVDDTPIVVVVNAG